MNVEKVFLQSLNCGLHNEKYTIEDNYTAESWIALLNLSNEHSILPLIYDTIYNSNIPSDVKAVMKRQSITESMMQIQRENEFYSIYKELMDMDIIPLVVKGIICRYTYPKPELRISGDEDVLIHSDELKKVHDYFINKGFVNDKEYSDDSEEIGYRNLATGTYIEVHTSLFSKESTYSFLNNEFKDPWKNKKEYTIHGCTFYSFSDTEHLFYLFAHAYKHFVHGGFGLRQLSDILMYLDTYRDGIDMNIITAQLEKYHLDNLWYNLLAIGNEYLGFHNDIPVTADNNDLLEDLLASGIYGRSSDERTHSANMTLSALSSTSTNKGIWKSLFPGYDYMASQFEGVKKHKFLLPYYYGVRIVNYKKRNKNASATIELGKQRIELLKKYKVIE